ncbi:hypothetical protein [Mycoplasmopsis cricetuli]|uniref:hypothetical protein n=1 Tax=Mycoplasmopsis cricetuli TaxID=171283 RepID=UPI0004705B16|nr:hypothetical protein [Mycoplasmopsis cricetuli]
MKIKKIFKFLTLTATMSVVPIASVSCLQGSYNLKAEIDEKKEVITVKASNLNKLFNGEKAYLQVLWENEENITSVENVLNEKLDNFVNVAGIKNTQLNSIFKKTNESQISTYVLDNDGIDRIIANNMDAKNLYETKKYMNFFFKSGDKTKSLIELFENSDNGSLIKNGEIEFKIPYSKFKDHVNKDSQLSIMYRIIRFGDDQSKETELVTGTSFVQFKGIKK